MVAELVGRERELDSVLGWLAEASTGSPRVVQVVGDAGIGKSALMSAVVGAAMEQGLALTLGRTTEIEGAPPFRPWHQVLGSIGGAELLGPVTAPDPGADRFARFDAVLDHLVRLAQAKTGLVVVIEDVHRADEPSVQLITHVADGLVDAPVCLLVTARGRAVEQSPAWASVAPQLCRLPGGRRLELTGLGTGAVAELLGADHRNEVGRIMEVTRGNPLFVTEQLRHLEAGGDLGRPPTSVVDAVRRRLAERSEVCVETLRVAAVVGRDFSAGLVATASGHSARAYLVVIEEAERAGLVEPTAPGSFRFVHVLVRDSVEADLGATGLAEIHRRVALAIETYEGAGDDQVADIARHWEAAAVLGDGDLAAKWCERAAAVADRQLAWEEAARLYDLAAVLAGPLGDPLDRHRRHLASARARLNCDDLNAAVDRCLRAADEARTLGRPDLLADAALLIEGRGGPGLAQLRALAEEALGAVGTDEFAVRGRLLGQMAACAFYLEPAATLSLSAASMDDAERSGDPLALVAAARARQMALSGPEHAHERLRLAGVIGDAGRALQWPSVSQWEPIWRIDALVELGRLGEAIAELAALRRFVDDVGVPMSRYHLYRIETLLAQATGRFDDGLEWGRRTCDLFARHEDPVGGEAMFVCLQAHMALHTGFDGDLVEAFDAIPFEQAPPFLGDLPLLAPMLALLGTGQVERSRVLYGRLAPVATWRPPRFLWLHLSSLRLWAAIALGRLDDVDALAAELDGHRGLHIAAGGGGLTYSGPVELWTGVAAAALDRDDLAVGDLRRTLDVCRANGATGFAVQAGVELVRSLRVRNGEGDLAEATVVLAEVAPLAATLGMSPWSEAAGDLAAQLGAASAPAGPDRGPLSPREFEVASLVAEGLSNRAIAERLFLSERTAQNHVQHILTKLGLSNRAQVTAWYLSR